MSVIDRLDPKGNFLIDAWLYIKVAFASFILALLFSIMYVIYMALSIMAIFGFYMMLMVGPIFVWFAAFRATRGIAFGWLKATLNYVLWIFFLSVVAGIFMKYVMAAVADLENWDLAKHGVFTAAYGQTLLFCALTSYLLFKTADLAALLSGGMAMGGRCGWGAEHRRQAVGSMVNPAARQAAGATWGIAKGGARAAMGAGLRTYSAMRDIKS